MVMQGFLVIWKKNKLEKESQEYSNSEENRKTLI